MTAAYQNHCAITGAKILLTLQAAHIRPVSNDGEHQVANGLLLRADVHMMFDNGLLGVDTGHRLQVSPQLRERYGNGQEFDSKAGQLIHLPVDRQDHPAAEFLEWHMDTVFGR